jgi:bacterioferritin-associated ferredoxin
VDLRLCQCNAVTELEVLVAIRRGARTVDEVGDACEAGTGCGSCRGAIKTMLEEEAQRRRAGAVPDAFYQLPLFNTPKLPR